MGMLLMAIVVSFIAGCAAGQSGPQVNIESESQIAIGKITGRHAGYELAKSYPGIAKDLMPICNDIIKEESSDILVTMAHSIADVLIEGQIDDALLKADIKDILTMIHIESGVEVTEQQMDIIQAVAEGLMSGIVIHQKEVQDA